jgi:hypothetical protein
MARAAETGATTFHPKHKRDRTEVPAVRRVCLKLPRETSLCYRPILVGEAPEAAKEGCTRVLQRADDIEVLLLFTRT